MLSAFSNLAACGSASLARLIPIWKKATTMMILLIALLPAVFIAVVAALTERKIWVTLTALAMAVLGAFTGNPVYLALDIFFVGLGYWFSLTYLKGCSPKKNMPHSAPSRPPINEKIKRPFGFITIIVAFGAIVFGKFAYQTGAELWDYKMLPESEYLAKESGLPTAFFNLPNWQQFSLAGQLKLILPCALHETVVKGSPLPAGVRNYVVSNCSAAGVYISVTRSHAIKSNLTFSAKAGAENAVSNIAAIFFQNTSVSSELLNSLGSFNVGSASATTFKTIGAWGKTRTKKYIVKGVAFSNGPNLYTITFVFEDRQESLTVVEKILSSIRET